jgi:hypothetical protein
MSIRFFVAHSSLPILILAIVALSGPPLAHKPSLPIRLLLLAARTLPQGYTVDYGGLSRQYIQGSYIQESCGFVATFRGTG